MNDWLLRAPVGLVLVAVYFAQLVWVIRNFDRNDYGPVSLTAFILGMCNLAAMVMLIGWLFILAGTYVVTGGLP